METAVVSWADPGELAERGPWDLVIGSDLLYERRNVPLVLDVLERLVAPGASAVIADPRRAAAAGFVERAGRSWQLRTTTDTGPPRVDLHELRRRLAVDLAQQRAGPGDARARGAHARGQRGVGRDHHQRPRLGMALDERGDVVVGGVAAQPPREAHRHPAPAAGVVGARPSKTTVTATSRSAAKASS